MYISNLQKDTLKNALPVKWRGVTGHHEEHGAAVVVADGVAQEGHHVESTALVDHAEVDRWRRVAEQNYSRS